MRVGVIRGDLPGSLFIADLEQTSQPYGTSIGSPGQTRYLSRPDLTKIGTLLASVPAGLNAASAVSFPLTVNGSNNTFKVKVNGAGAFTTATIASAAYANMTTLLAALNAALVTAGADVVAVAQYNDATKILIHTVAALGVGSSLAIDSTAGGSNADASLGFGTLALSATVSTAAAVVTATNPVGGPVDVSLATLLALDSKGIGGATSATLTAIQDAIAPKFVETAVARSSFLKGNLKGYLSSTYTPDSTRTPALALGAAISVVTDDGVTIYT